MGDLTGQEETSSNAALPHEALGYASLNRREGTSVKCQRARPFGDTPVTAITVTCASGAPARYTTSRPFLNGLVSALTAGIYAPTTVTIRCSTGQSAQLQLSRKEIVSILTAPAFRERMETVLPGRLREVESGIEALEEDLADAFVDG